MILKNFSEIQLEFLTNNYNYEYSMLSNEYFSIFLIIVFSIFLSVLILLLSYILVLQAPDTEKLSTYECGFEPYEDARHQFDVRFYLVAILFIVFDIEAMFVYPWCVTLGTLHITGFWAMIDFIIELGIGYVYIWLVGALNWD